MKQQASKKQNGPGPVRTGAVGARTVWGEGGDMAISCALVIPPLGTDGGRDQSIITVEVEVVADSRGSQAVVGWTAGWLDGWMAGPADLGLGLRDPDLCLVSRLLCLCVCLPVRPQLDCRIRRACCGGQEPGEVMTRAQTAMDLLGSLHTLQLDSAWMMRLPVARKNPLCLEEDLPSLATCSLRLNNG